MIAAAWTFARGFLGPYAQAAAITACVVGLLGLGVPLLKINNAIVSERAEKKATQICEDKERADRLEKEVRAIRDAKEVSDATVRDRNVALSESGIRVSILEAQLGEARDALAKTKGSVRCVFPVDDPWLRRKRARQAASSASGGRGADPVP